MFLPSQYSWVDPQSKDMAAVPPSLILFTPLLGVKEYGCIELELPREAQFLHCESVWAVLHLSSHQFARLSLQSGGGCGARRILTCRPSLAINFCGSIGLATIRNVA